MTNLVYAVTTKHAGSGIIQMIFWSRFKIPNRMIWNPLVERQLAKRLQKFAWRKCWNSQLEQRDEIWIPKGHAILLIGVSHYSNANSVQKKLRFQDIFVYKILCSGFRLSRLGFWVYSPRPFKRNYSQPVWQWLHKWTPLKYGMNQENILCIGRPPVLRLIYVLWRLLPGVELLAPYKFGKIPIPPSHISLSTKTHLTYRMGEAQDFFPWFLVPLMSWPLCRFWVICSNA